MKTKENKKPTPPVTSSSLTFLAKLALQNFEGCHEVASAKEEKQKRNGESLPLCIEVLLETNNSQAISVVQLPHISNAEGNQ
eukprot:m.154536 g.154536  ORF g.154536 m.154536 type:complete len:82 (-) comp24631_c0_seq3:914-1159(-)